MAEIQMGTPAGTVADACAMSNFDINKLSYITLLGMVFHSGVLCSVFRNLIKQSITSFRNGSVRLYYKNSHGTLMCKAV